MAVLRKKTPPITVQVGDGLPTIFMNYDDAWQSMRTEEKYIDGVLHTRRVHDIHIEGQWRKDEREQ